MKRTKPLFLVSITLFLISCNVTTRPSTSAPAVGNIQLIGQVEESSLTISEIGVARGSTVAGDYAYASMPKCTLDTDDGRYLCNESWLRIIDVSDPTAPTETALHTVPYSIDTMIASAGHLYVAQGYYGLKVLDISALSSPNEINSCELSSSREINDISIVKNHVYVSGWRCATESNCNAGLWILNISNLMAIAETSFYEVVEDAVRNVLVADKYILVVRKHISEGFMANPKFTGSFQRIDESNPIAVTEISSVDLLTNVHDMMVSGNYIYIAYGQEGLQVIDISDPAEPVVAGSYNTPRGVWGIATDDIAEDHLYAIDSKGAVYILKFTQNGE